MFYADLWGDRAGKYAALAAQDIAATRWQRLAPSAPFYLFVPQDTELLPEYELGWKVSDIFLVTSTGVKTHRDHFVIDYQRGSLELKMRQFRDLSVDDALIREYGLPDTQEWRLSKQRQLVSNVTDWEQYLTPYLYRPFDMREIFYRPEVIDRPRPEVMQHLLSHQNLGLITTRQTRDVWQALATQFICDHKSCAAYDTNNLFPLYLYPGAVGSGRRQASLLPDEAGSGAGGRRPNLSPAFVAEIGARLGLQFVGDGAGDLRETWGPEDVFHYAYAVFHSPTFRSRYAPFLKIDFPRLPLTRDRALFAELVQLGAQLVDLHLLRLPGAGGVGGAGGAAILQRPGAQGARFPQNGSNRVDTIVYAPPTDEHAGRVRINDAQYFEGIDPATWAMQIGGYQPLEKWLKDRKGRVLTADDVPHYLRMVIALRETRRLMAAIDAAIPQWPMR